MSAIIDTIIVGGGPAGLSAALLLVRCLNNVVVCDVGHPRNEPSRIFKGYLSATVHASNLAITRLCHCDSQVADVVRGEGRVHGDPRIG